MESCYILCVVLIVLIGGFSTYDFNRWNSDITRLSFSYIKLRLFLQNPKLLYFEMAIQRHFETIE